MPYLIAIIVLVVVALGFTLFRSSTPTENTEIVTLNSSSTAQGAVVEVPKDDRTPTNTTDAAPADSNSAYADGTYNTQVTYLTPIRKEYKLDIEMTVKDGIVTSADVDYSQGAEVDPNAQNFEAAYKTEVIGQSLDSINLSRVGGASLTTGAFNKALAEIKTDAAA